MSEGGLDAAHRAFEAGDFAEARRLARELQTGGPDDATRAAAREILKRTGIDPAVVYMTIGAAVLFFLIVFLSLR